MPITEKQRDAYMAEIARQQALAIECERYTADVVAQLHQAETAGVPFNRISLIAARNALQTEALDLTIANLEKQLPGATIVVRSPETKI